MSNGLYHIYGGPASPYSHKLRAVFRYRRLPHTWQVPQGGFNGAGSLGHDTSAQTPLQEAKKPVVPVVKYPDGEYKADSTPIMRELEALYRQRSLLPPNPGIAYLAFLVEDMADEYMPLPMFYFRWTEDAEWCSRRQMVGWGGALNDDDLESLAKNFRERQQAQLGAQASTPKESVVNNYRNILSALEQQLKSSLFLFGDRPSFAEFGLYGQLSQYVIDPVVSNIMKAEAVRAFQWVWYMDDLSGIEPGEWWEPERCLTEELAGLLKGMVPYFGLAQMLQERIGMDNLDESVNGTHYRVKCYLAMKQELASLSEADRELIRPVLEDANCWDHLQFKPGEQEKVVSILTA